MGKAVRVHTLAKELGVPSKEILAKCVAEGIELKGHMSPVSAGLEESIREWFSPGADVTSVEAAPIVDLEKVRVHAPKKAAGGQGATALAEPPPRKRGAAADDEHSPEAEVALEGPSPVAAPETISKPAEPPGAPSPVAPAPASPSPVVPPPAPVEPPAPPITERIAARAPEDAPPKPALPSEPVVARPVVPPPPPAPPAPPPPPVRPAGPQLVPRPAQLTGPRVVRIEQPETVRAPRPRAPLTEIAAPVADRGASATPRRGRGKGGRADEEAEAAKARAAKKPVRGSDLVMERMKEWRDQDLLERKERLASATGHGLRDRRAAERRRQASTPAPAAPAGGRKGAIEIVAPISIKSFCAAIGVAFPQVAAKLIEHTGAPRSLNQTLDAETAELIAMELGVPVRVVRAKSALEKLEEEFQNRPRENVQPRPPVVAMLGHVDHGKTSLLDAIRRTNVAAGEAGGITQHIGAYRIDRGDWHVSFLDTPGHEAFTAMRARGANLTDVVVLVVAADDGVMPQTVEALNHAKAAGVPIVVALNKIDLPGVDLNKIYGQLAEHELTPTEWGGQTDVIKTAAVKGQGIDELIAHLSTLSELLDLKADPSVPAQATVIEAQMREGQGVVAHVLVREGTLKPGQIVVCGPGAGRIRALSDDQGRRVKEAPPGTPVEVSGLDELPQAGDKLLVVDDLSKAKEIASETRQRLREATLQTVNKPRTLEELLRGTETSEIPSLNIIIKADVQGSVDALKSKLSEFPAGKARLIILHAAVGAVTEADVRLAQASDAIIIGFHVVAEDRARQLAEQVGVEIRVYRIIYEVTQDVHKALEGLLAPMKREEARGVAEVRKVFNVSRIGTVAGCYVSDGVIARAHRVRLVRDGRIVLDAAPLASLKRVKDDVREVKAGLECGIKIQDFDDVKPGDRIEAFEVIEVAQQL